MTSTPVIGIDLGTTYSCVAVLQNSSNVIIPDEQGNFKIPNCVAFTEGGLLIGDDAKNNLECNPSNTVFDARRLFGRSLEDLLVEVNTKRWPFEVVSVDGRLKIQIQSGSEVKQFFPEEISSLVLTKLKKMAEAFLGKPVKNAVITVPAHFNDFQRQATRDAGSMAGLNVLQIIDEPTAIAYAYGLIKRGYRKHKVLIFDLGGGTLDVSLLSIEDGHIVAKSSFNDSYLGGEDFNNRMVNHFVLEFYEKFKKNLATDRKALRRLRAACEKAKTTLSSSTEVSIQLSSLYEGIDFSSTITRSHFLELNTDLFSKILSTVNSALLEANFDPADSGVLNVIAVGGSMRIPVIKKFLEAYFHRKLNISNNPDHKVALGAALQADILIAGQIQNMSLFDETPLSLGFEDQNGLNRVLIPRNTTIPVKRTVTLKTTLDYQTEYTIYVYEGERVLNMYNNLLGELYITDITPAPRGIPEIDLSFEITTDGILNIFAVERNSGMNDKLTIPYNKGRLPKEECERMVNDAKHHKVDDVKVMNRLKAKHILQEYTVNVRSCVEITLNGNISADVREDVLDKVNETERWLESNQDADNLEIIQKFLELYTFFVPIFLELYNPIRPT